MTESLAVHSECTEIDSVIGGILLRQLCELDTPRVEYLVNYDTDHFNSVNESMPDVVSSPERLLEWITSSSESDVRTHNTKFGIWAHGEMVGCIGYRVYDEDLKTAELWAWVSKEFAGHGYAGSATEILCDYLFREGYENAEAKVRPANKASRKSLVNAGFTAVKISGDFMHYRLKNPGAIITSGQKIETLHIDRF